MSSIRTLIASYDPIYLLGLKSLLEHEENIEVVDCTFNHLEMHIHHISFHILIIHVPFLNIETIEWIRHIKKRYSFAHFILICPCYHHAIASMAHEAGASAIVTSEIFQAKLKTILQQVASGQALFLIEHQSFNQKLSNIEICILQIIANDYTNKQISEQLGISKRTVERHLSSCFEKLEVSSRAGAIAVAMRLKLIE